MENTLHPFISIGHFELYRVFLLNC